MVSYLISALTQGAKVVTYLGSLVQSCSGEGGTQQTNITGVYGECSQCLGHTGFAPTHGVCAFPVYTSQALGCSARELSEVGPGLHTLPRSKPLTFRFLGTPQRCRLSWACILCPSQVRAAQVTKCLASALSLGAAHLITSPVPAARFPRCAISDVLCVSSQELISGCNPPGRCHPSRIPGRLGWQLGACPQFGGGCRLWGWVFHFPALAAPAPASLPW